MDLCEKFDFTTAASSDDEDEENIRPKNVSKRNNVVLTSGRLIIIFSVNTALSVSRQCCFFTLFTPFNQYSNIFFLYTFTY